MKIHSNNLAVKGITEIPQTSYQLYQIEIVNYHYREVALSCAEPEGSNVLFTFQVSYFILALQSSNLVMWNHEANGYHGYHGYIAFRQLTTRND